ncbi:MAG: HAMP domain-containing methyl-accepting chemotaxis protein [Candidatus Contendobacter sp.]|nr:HAMP domain-containing methyl-accepting chemotaxis protein [Candidatus Contendobacter sp.]
MSSSVSQFSATTQTQTNLSALTESVRSNLLGLVNKVVLGSINWEEADASLLQATSDINKAWQRYQDERGALNPQGQVNDASAGDIAGIQKLINAVENLFAKRDRTRLGLFVANDLEALSDPFFKAMLEASSRVSAQSAQALTLAQQTSQQFRLLIAGLAGFGLLASILIGVIIYRSIFRPVHRIASVVEQIGKGNYSSRTSLIGGDELSQLGQAFDNMLGERVNTLVQVERENEQLNDSVIGLLHAVSQLSQKDLTVKVPVTEDVTGPVADALNLLTAETAKVLQGVTQISEQVATASDTVKAQSDTVITVADRERRAVEQTAADLAAAADAMKQIAQLAQTCNAAAETAIKTTQTALQTVTSTVSGINNTRDTIRETEKRIKRLGERSQEISGVVNLINTIAERTHILALNASMHAASAGEAGRGFAVVAGEVQRLAENAREATSQIATLVNNIQIETADTVNTMNTAISQVVDGSRLAEQAGDQMKRTQETTAELVAAVQQIASRSQEQARVSNELLERAQQIQESARQTSQQLQEQTTHTTNLVEYARGLLNSVRVFRLPA